MQVIVVVIEGPERCDAGVVHTHTHCALVKQKLGAQCVVLCLSCANCVSEGRARVGGLGNGCHIFDPPAAIAWWCCSSVQQAVGLLHAVLGSRTGN